MEAAKKIFNNPVAPLPLPKGCEVVDVSDRMPSLTGCDMGLGMTLFHLIRTTLDKERFCKCVMAVNQKKAPGISGKRDRDNFRKMTRELKMELKPRELNDIMSSFGNRQSEYARIYSAQDRTGGTWIAIYDGYPLASSSISSHEDRYPLRRTYLQALESISKFGTQNRLQYASRLFGLYYGTGKVEEVAWQTVDTPYNRAQAETGTVALGFAAPEPGQVFGIWFNNHILVLRNNSKSVGLAPAKLRTNRPAQFQHLESTLSRVFDMDISILHELHTTHCWQ